MNMIEFKSNINKDLPYDRQRYIASMDVGSVSEWYGVSFQLAGEIEGKIDFTKFVKTYERLFKNVVVQLDNGSFWIINHDDKDMKWLPNSDDNLPHLRTLFQQRNISNDFTGGIVFAKDDLLEFSKDLISYPYIVLSKDGFLYKNLDISHGELQFIIKISGHLNIDFLSTNKSLLKRVVNNNSSATFNVKEYRGTSLVNISE
jgi:hypothetical protein